MRDGGWCSERGRGGKQFLMPRRAERERENGKERSESGNSLLFFFFFSLRPRLGASRVQAVSISSSACTHTQRGRLHTLRPCTQNTRPLHLRARAGVQTRCTHRRAASPLLSVDRARDPPPSLTPHRHPMLASGMRAGWGLLWKEVRQATQAHLSPLVPSPTNTGQFFSPSLPTLTLPMANMQGQDWNPVILSKRRPGAKETQTPAVCREERGKREGGKRSPPPRSAPSFLLRPLPSPPPPLSSSLSNL